MENKTGQTVLITGASSGIGYELARCFARDHFEIIMVAHHEKKLREAAEQLQQEFQHVNIHNLAADLTRDDAPQKVYAEVQRNGWQVDVLVNNAGFGEYGPFSESDLKKELAMIHLNVIALVHLTKLFLPPILRLQRGKILQVGSVASFMPAPLQSVYGATKAFILSFSEALQEELKETGVTVTVLCPPATDTNFFRVAGAENSKIAQGSLASAEEVAAGGYAALMKGEARAVPTFKAKAEVAASNILPDSVMAAAMHKQSEEVKPKRASRAKKETTTDGASTPATETPTVPTAAIPAPSTATRKRSSSQTTQTESGTTETAAKTSSRKKKA
ncbi:MAG: SDR family NAD(P)-dependent oxidoreductase [Adhaeribacter sp.]